MNVYEKLAKARVMFQANNPKMSGKNAYAGYTYFELSDILPVVNKIGAEIGFVCEVSFTKDEAVLTLRNTEKPDEAVCFTSPMSTASLKGCHEVQNLGAVQTYIKRYLYQNAFEIVESDALNAGTKEEKPAKNDIAEKEKVFIAEFEKLQNELAVYLNKKGIFERPENVRQVIAAKDVKQMKIALSHAKANEKMLAEKAKPAPAIPENLF